jgi:hypothetical protein
MIRTFHIKILRVSYLRLAFLGVHHVRSLDSVVVRVNPEYILRSGIKIDGLHPLLVVYHIHLLSGAQIIGPELGSIGKEHDNVFLLDAADTTLAIRQLETLPAGTGIRTVQISADMRTLMLTALTLVNVHAMFPVVLRNYVTSVAGTDIAAIGDIVALLRATAAVILRTVMAVIWKDARRLFGSRSRLDRRCRVLRAILTASQFI